jgi:hypothetical protein
MVIAGSLDIFQEKMSDLMATLKFVQTYLDLGYVLTRDGIKPQVNKVGTSDTCTSTAQKCQRTPQFSGDGSIL